MWSDENHQYCFTQWISKLPWQYLVNFMGLAGIVNTVIYKTKQIFTVNFQGLRQDKLSKFLTMDAYIHQKASMY